MFIAYVFLVLVLIVVIFQFVLALGAPLGEYTLAGKYPGKLPARMRLVALIQILILVLFALIVLIRAGLLLEQFYQFSRAAIWFVSGFFILGSITNLTSPSLKERRLWGPVNVLMLVLSLVIALS